jgi:hypothetical protein
LFVFIDSGIFIEFGSLVGCKFVLDGILDADVHLSFGINLLLLVRIRVYCIKSIKKNVNSEQNKSGSKVFHYLVLIYYFSNAHLRRF